MEHDKSRDPPDPLSKAERSYILRLAQAAEMAKETPAHYPIHAAKMCSRDWMVMQGRVVGFREFIFIPYACGRKFCPSCVREWSKRLGKRILGPAAKAGPKRLRHLVLTIPNPKPGGLHHGLDELQHCFREWRNQGRRKAHGSFWLQQAGYCSKIEIERSPRTGWHPHIHILLDCPRGFDFRRNSHARKAWERITEHRLGQAAVANWISNGKHVDIAREVAKYVTKPLTLETLSPTDIMEAAEALHRRRIHTSQGTLLAPDEEEKPGGYAYLAKLSDLYNRASEAIAAGIDVGRLLADFRAENVGDKLIMARVPALQSLLEPDPEPIEPISPLAGG